MQGALLPRHLASKGNPLQETHTLEERVRALTDQVKSSEEYRGWLAEKFSECQKVVEEMSEEAEAKDEELKGLKACVLEDENKELRGGLARVEKYIRESEHMSKASWNVLSHVREFLNSLGVHNPEPNHEAGDGLTSLGWVVRCRPSATTAPALHGPEPSTPCTPGPSHGGRRSTLL